MKLALRYGLIGGLLLIAYLSALYLFDKTLLVEGWEKLTWLMILVLMLAAAAHRRSQEPDAFISFKPLLQTVFQTFVIAYLLKFIFVYILFRYLDTEMLELVKMAEIQLIMEFKDPELPETIFKERVDAYAAGDFGPRIADIGVMFELIFGFILSAVIAGIFRRDTPSYE